jgi:enoyl-CoA hydratase
MGILGQQEIHTGNTMSQQHFETFDLSIENDIAHICLNRPDKRNSMIPSFWEDLPNVIEDIDGNARARVIVISSTGPVFTAGMDLNAFAPKQHENPDDAKRDRIRHGAAFYDTARKTQAAFNALEGLPFAGTRSNSRRLCGRRSGHGNRL